MYWMVIGAFFAWPTISRGWQFFQNAHTAYAVMRTASIVTCSTANAGVSAAQYGYEGFKKGWAYFNPSDNSSLEFIDHPQEEFIEVRKVIPPEGTSPSNGINK